MPDYDPKSIPILDDVIETGDLEQADAEDKHKAPIADITDMEDELSVDDGTLNLFSTAPVELSPEDAIIEDGTADDSHIDDLDAGDSGPSIGTIDSLGDPLDDSHGDAVGDTSPVETNDEDTSSYHAKADIEDGEAEHVEEEAYESALIDYHDDTDAAVETGDQPPPEPHTETRQAEDGQHVETEELENSNIQQAIVTQATQATIALDDIVDDVVNDIVSHLVPDLQQQLKYLVQQALEDRLPAEIITQDKPDSDQNDS